MWSWDVGLDDLVNVRLHHVIDVTTFKQLFGFLLAELFFRPVEFNLACDVQSIVYS